MISAGLLTSPSFDLRDDLSVWSAIVGAVAIILLGTGTYLVVCKLRALRPQRGEAGPMPSAQDSGELFRAVADTAIDAIISADRNGNLTYWNKAAERMFEYPTGDVVGQPLTFLMPVRFREAHLAGLSRRVSTGESRVIGKVVELAGLRKDGSEFPLELSLSAWESPEGLVFTGIVRDITRRKQVERRLHAEHTVTRLLAESPTLHEATPKILQAICESLEWEMGQFWSVDQDADLIRCTDIWHSPSVNMVRFIAISKVTAFPRGTGLPGRVWASGAPTWIPDVLKDANFPRLAIAAKEGLHAALGFPIQRPGLVLGVMEFFSRKIQEPDTDLLQMLSAIGSQIGQFMERKRAEERIHALKEYVQTILDSVPDPIVILNLDAQVQYLNGAFTKAFNIQQSDVGTVFDLLKADDPTREQLEEELTTCARSGQETGLPASRHVTEPAAPRDPLAPLPSRSDRQRRKEIKFGRRTYHYTWFPVEAHSDAGTLMGLVLRDTTEESSLQDRLIQAEKLAGIALLVSGLGHELNNPLYIVLGLSEAILDEPDPTVIKDHVRNLVEAAKRMDRIIKDLTGRTHVEGIDVRAEVDVNEQLDHALALTGLGQPGEKLEIVKNYAPVSKIWASPLEIRQVFVNVISNAVQAMEGTGTLELGTHLDRDTVTVTIQDSGPGIPAAYVSKVFDPFFTTKKQGEGTGLGLTIAHRIITKHGGQIRVESRVRQGAAFTMIFPLSDARAGPVAEQ
jgi:PAS domain S-box-containing protein